MGYQNQDAIVLDAQNKLIFMKVHIFQFYI